MKKYLPWLVLVTVAVAILFGKSALFRFLALTDRVDADLLVVEGWTGREGLAQAAEEIKTFGYRRVIVASLTYPYDSTEAFEVSNTGGLVFDFSRSGGPLLSDSVSVYAASHDFKGIPAHFKLWVNDSLIGETYTRSSLAPYSFALPPVPVGQVTVEFDNDGYERDVGDRDLEVQAIRLAGKMFYARMPNVRYDLGTIDGVRTRRTDARSEADWALDMLRQEGIPDSIMVSVAAPLTRYDKTFTTAMAVRTWLAQQPDPMPLALNLYSESAHARRSRLLYQKALGDRISIGVVSLPRRDTSADTWWKRLSTISYTSSQVAKYLYARLFFWPDVEHD